MDAESPTASQHVYDGDGEAIPACRGRTASARVAGWTGVRAETPLPIGVVAFLIGLVARRQLEFHFRHRVAR